MSEIACAFLLGKWADAMGLVVTDAPPLYFGLKRSITLPPGVILQITPRIKPSSTSLFALFQKCMFLVRLLSSMSSILVFLDCSLLLFIRYAQFASQRARHASRSDLANDLDI
jgi:hypothetical protein